MTQASDKWPSRSEEAEEEQVVETEGEEGVARTTCTHKFAVLVEGILVRTWSLRGIPHSRYALYTKPSHSPKQLRLEHF